MKKFFIFSAAYWLLSIISVLFVERPVAVLTGYALIYLPLALFELWKAFDGPYHFIARTLTRNQKLLEWLFEYAKRNSVGIEHLPGYMNRWYLFNPVNEATGRRKWNWIPLSIRFHEILRADEDRHNHNHPWNATSIILRGWYREVRPVGSGYEVEVTREEGDVVKIGYGDFHRITEVSPDYPPLTLFFYGQWQGPWGFKTADGFIKWRDYLNQKRTAVKTDIQVSVTGNAADVLKNIAANMPPKRNPGPLQGRRCAYCDGTGDVHRPDGVWLGSCLNCDAAHRPIPTPWSENGVEEPMVGPDTKIAQQDEAREFGWGEHRGNP